MKHGVANDLGVNTHSWHFKQLPVEERVTLLSREVDGCMVFFGERSADGYGRIYSKGKRYMVHRLMWELANGEIPHGMQLDHLCKNEPCWNLNHLRMVTPRVNTLASDNPAAKNAVKTHCPNGHEYAGENLGIYVTRSGSVNRQCKTCRRERQRIAQAKRRVQAFEDSSGNFH